MHQIKETYTEYTLEMGQIKASADPAILTCYGLGSCVGVFLYDRLNKIGGGAHITLPAYNEFHQVDSKLHYADCAIETLLYRMQSMGASTISLRAKMVGGANITGFSGMCMGLKNIESVKSILSRKGIFLAGNDVGGKAGRRARFNTHSGNLEVTNESTTYIV